MKIFLTGATGGIGVAILTSLADHELTTIGRPNESFIPQTFDWLIFAHGIIEEVNTVDTFLANTITCIDFTKYLLPHMNPTNVHAGIIFISSTAGITGNSKFPIYSASKAALNIYVKAMAKAHKSISFYSVCPGPTDTKMWRSLGLESKAQPPSEVAKVVLDILGGKYTSGDIITVRDGVAGVV